MKTRILIFLLAAAYCSATSAQTVNEIVAKYIKATGGAEKMRAVRSLIMQNTIAVQGLELENTATIVVNKNIRSESVINGNRSIQGFDGNKAWQIVPKIMGGTNEPEEMEVNAAKSLLWQMDPFPLLDYAAKKTKLEYLGSEKSRDKQYWHLKMTAKDGLESDLWIDISTGLLRIQQVTLEGISTGLVFNEHKEQNGVLFPMITIISSEATGKVTVTTKGILVNPAIDASVFQFPVQK